jgi:uncharacterized repeat protein (TIGR04138 family)
MAKKPTDKDRQIADAMEQLIRTDGRYPIEAFAFLHDGLSVAVKRVHGESPDLEPGRRHVSGAELCGALRDHAIERWGLLARTVLRRWNVNATIDFGHMVYLLVDNGFMQKTEDDSLNDFREVFDFEKAFRITAQFELKD